MQLDSHSGRLALSRLLLLIMAVLTLAWVTLIPRPAEATSTENLELGEVEQTCPDPDELPVKSSMLPVIKVAGLLDPVLRRYILDNLAEALADPSAVGLILQVNSNGDVLSDHEFLSLAKALREASAREGFEIGLWVGQPGSTAQGGVAELATVVDFVGVTPNSTIGNTGRHRLPPQWGSPFGDLSTHMETATIDAVEATAANISVGPGQNMIPIGSFAAHFGGFEVFQCLNESGSIITFPLSQTRLKGIPLDLQLAHTVSSPEVAYLLFVLGLAIVVFELFVAGVGVAGMIGAVLTVMGSYGLANLPLNGWALVVLMVSFFFLAVDIQTNVPRFYTVAGLIMFSVASLFIYDGIAMSTVTLIAGVIGACLYAYSGMPSMVRTRFSIPTIGRDEMVGELGAAITDISPEGTVVIGGAPWRAITNRATPIGQGDEVRVVNIDRLLLEVEPIEGAAKDYRRR